MVIENISENLSIPKDISLGATIFNMMGQYEAYIENYKNIIEYHEERIKLQGKSCKIQIDGKNLKIEYFSTNGMKIKGRFIKIEFLP